MVLSVNVCTPTEVITPRHHDLTGLKLSVHSLGKIKTEARLGPMRRDAAAREEGSYVRRPSLWRASTRPALPDRDCLIQLPLSSRSTAPGRSPFSAITHANGTACNISSLRKPFPAVSSTELSLYLSLAASLSLTPSRHVSPSCLPVHLSLSVSLCVSLCWVEKKKKETPTSCSSTWVLSGREIQIPARVVSIFPAVFSLRLSFPSSTSDIRGLRERPR